MKKIILLVLAVTASNFYAQVGMGTTQPHASSVLELSSTKQGFLLPRMTNEQLKEIENPAEALMVYNTDLDCVMIHVEGSYNCTQNPVATTPVATSDLGGSTTFDSHYNGWNGTYSVGGASDTATSHTAGEAFSANTDCTNKQISISACNGATVTGKSGIQYRIIDINGQCWMQDNLQEVPSNFANFDGTFTVQAGSLGYWGFTGAQLSRTFGTTAPTAEPKAGYLYTWNAAMDNSTTERSRGACPQGFHIPSDCEIMYLEHGMGMSLADQVELDWDRGYVSNRGNVVAKLKRGTTSPDFNNFNVGHLRASNNRFETSNGSNLGMWSSTEVTDSAAFFRYSNSSGNNSSLGLRRGELKSAGFAVRCLKD